MELKHSRYDFTWIGRCVYDTHDKIWGCFNYIDPTGQNKYARSDCFAFWARTGKTLQFSKHSGSTYYTVNRLILQKESRKYKMITLDNLVDIWPSFLTDLDEKFIFFMLVGD